MSRRTLFGAMLLCGACAILSGCMRKMKIEELKAKMPERPVALDRLDRCAGKWQWNGTVKMAVLDEPLKVSGTSEYKWEGDRWYLVGHHLMDVEHFELAKALETWTYDTKAERYRATWVDSMGMTSNGAGNYDDDDGIWKMKAVGHGPWGRTSNKFSIKFTSPDTVEFCWTEYTGLMKTMEMSLTGERVD